MSNKIFFELRKLSPHKKKKWIKSYIKQDYQESLFQR